MIEKIYTPGCGVYFGKNNEIFAIILDVVDGNIILECDGYVYSKNYSCISNFKKSTTTLTDESYLKYIYDKYFTGTEFIIGKIYRLGNRRTCSIVNTTNNREYILDTVFDLDRLRSITTRTIPCKNSKNSLLSL